MRKAGLYNLTLTGNVETQENRWRGEANKSWDRFFEFDEGNIVLHMGRMVVSKKRMSCWEQQRRGRRGAPLDP